MAYDMSGGIRRQSCTVAVRPAPVVLAHSAAAPGRCTLGTMSQPNPLDDLKARIAELLKTSPARDIEKNVNALFASFFDRFDLASRDDLDVQRKLLERARLRLEQLEARVAELEARKP